MLTLDVLRERFAHWSRLEVTATSPLYQALSARIVTDDALLKLASATRAQQPPPNMLFAAVQDVLLRGDAHPLAEFYGSVHPNPRTDVAHAYESFRAFCLQHTDEIRHLLATRITQTNEVRRSAILLPLLALFAQQTGAPLSLIEVGASAGLNLMWDRYCYVYQRDGHAYTIAPPQDQPTLTLSCELRPTATPMPIPAALPSVAWRAGIDINPLDVRDADTVRWLRALIWPEHHERRANFDQAIAQAQAAPPSIHHGDALDVLPPLIASLPPSAPLCVYHTHVLYQFTPSDRAALVEQLRTASADGRMVCLIGQEQIGIPRTELTYRLFQNGVETAHILAGYPADHGAWLEWVWSPVAL
jgi:hypothetical protein